jgi:hypothetical protein
VGEADRERYRREALSLAGRLEGPGAETEDDVWQVYAATEKLIAMLKFRLDYETPGIFAKLPEADEPAKLVEAARRLLSKAAVEISEEKLVLSIETLRKARNNLRRYLVDNKRPRPTTGLRGDTPA